jgi:glutathione S-transferase
MAKSRQNAVRRLPPNGLTRLSESRRRKAAFVELYQAEWCPHSHKVRQKLTELGLDFWARQVAADPDERRQMQQHVGTNEIPVLVPDDGEPLCGEDDILEYLGRLDPSPDAAAHREKAREEVPTFVEVVGSAQR